VRLPSPASPASPGDLARTAERLNGPGARALAALSDREILGAWEATVAAFLDPGSPERRALSDRSRLDLSDEGGGELARATRLSPEGLEAGLAAVLGGVRGEAARALFEEAERLRRGRAAVDGFALAVLASNLPALAVQPLLPALAARRPMLLKCPSAEPLFTPAFVRALAARSPALGEAVAVAVWPGGDEEREAPLLARAGVVLAYGELEAVESLERRTREANPGARFVPYGPRTSLAVVGAEADPEEVATGLARDVALFDQRGCLSVAAVYVEGVEGSQERARRVAEALAGALRELAARWPPGPAAVDEMGDAAAVRQLRELAGMRGLDLFEVGGGLAAGTVLVEPEPAFQPTPGLRTVRVHPLADLARLPEILAAWQEGQDRLQGVVIAGVPKEKAGTLVPALQNLGVSRVAAPGELQHPDTAWHNGGVNPLAVLV
jgi:hypothetical protein